MITCTATTEILEQLCRATLQAMDNETDDLTVAAADRVWKCVATGVCMTAESAFMFETLEMLRLRLASESMTSFQDGLDKQQVERFHSLDRELQQLGEA